MNSSASELVEELVGLIRTAPAGTRLPPTRELQRRHRVGPATVQRAVSDLARQGLVRTQPGEGTFTVPRRPPVTAVGPDLDWQTLALGPVVPGADALAANLEVPAPGLVSLATGYLDESLQPTGLLALAATRSARKAGAWSRPPLEGIDELRSLFATELGGGTDRRDVLVTPGGQAALSTCFRSLARPGDTVLVESPTYQGALAAARTAGLVPLGVPTDAEGLRVEMLADRLESSGARLIYAQPRWINPTGARMSNARRAQVLALLRSSGALLIEDDAARDLDVAPSPFVPLATDDPDGHVVYLRSVTKSVAPALRIAGLVARGPAFTRLRAAHSVQNAFVSTILQHVTCDVLTAPGWPRHLRRVRTELTQRRNALTGALARHLPDWTVPHTPTCGLHLWVRLPDGEDEDEVVRSSEAAGVRVIAGRHYYPAEAVGGHLRISYAANPPASLETAVRQIAGARS